MPARQIVLSHAVDMRSVCRHGILQSFAGLLITSRPTRSWMRSLIGKLSIGSPKSLHQKKTLVKVAFPGGFETADGTHVNLCDTVELKNGDFLRVLQYEKHTKGSSYRKRVIRGWLFRRVNKTIGLSREHPNEVYQVNYLGDQTAQLSSEHQVIQETSSAKVLRKRDLRLVTSPHHVLENRNGGTPETTKGLDILFCRWRQEFRINKATANKAVDAFNLKKSSLVEVAYLSLRPEPCEQKGSDEISRERPGQEKGD